MFVAADRREAIELAPPGQARLALWLEARFAASLPGFSTSTRGFLAAQFWHQSGCLQLSDEHAILELNPLPLSVVLQLGGCIGPELCRLDWLQGQKLSIRIKEVP
ncbi:hypothetical protein LH51_10970 [Nitrincola sp. A-D6]|uniref:hypothetical protein n=1 Tax=Nitrincola sp. A-D6 TaxID=1545442 RepID=UPI00051FE608|nr:hypothetical protein [Nitrincola sp. A-D6]KGK41933.1 hypothetical protein LH51_10970 [Nitrincola sp. A-D6]